ncbi:MAG: metallophosphoesterase [Myxococcales bacterium]
MMVPLLPWRASCVVFAGCTALVAAAVTLYDARLWRSRWFSSFVGAAWAAVAVGLLLWRADAPAVAQLGVELSWFLLPLLAAGGVAMLIAAPVHRLLGVLARRRARGAKSARAGARREFLRHAAAVLPASAVAVGAAAMSGNDTTQIVHVPLTFRGLHPALAGLRILHLSDLHLGLGRTARDLAQLLDGLRADPPDLIVLTGDVADKLEELEAALGLVSDFGARLGVFAALGNHEYLNDIEQMLPAYQRSDVRLLLNETASITVGDATLFLAGVDDPIFSGAPRPFFERVVADCAVSAPVDAFRLLLCHRPEGFEAAAKHGFHLTLSGHTHGGQVGLFGRSMFEVVLGIPYLWGAYRRGNSRLYTTSGFGLWFPFRLNCPAEAPVITLIADG